MKTLITNIQANHLRRMVFLFAMILLVTEVFAQLPTSFQKVELVTGLKNSVNFEFAPDGRIFIMDRYGEIFIYKPNTQVTVSAGILNVFHDMEDGLLALAFDPNFTTNNFVYIHYSDPVLPKNKVSRFHMNGDQLDLTSEVVLIEWTSDRNGYFHSAGDMDFDSAGNLYIAIGDNTNHTGYAPLNESDRNQSAERTSSNTNDLRGKILRIKPNSNGTYSVPAGNLFPNGVGGRAEIYVMGARNPFKIFVDKTNTDWLFWGEVGPDANVESPLGPEGMDEINLVKTAGNYGWPYITGKNEPYLNTYKSPNFYYDHANPVNLSKWNTGAINLPPARASWLEFFHGCYLAGPRYYFNSAINNPKKLPADFHQRFFYFDFNTSKIWVVSMDASGNVSSNQRFAENIITGSGFIDLKIGPDGQLYILEYGAGCCPNNVGSGKLLRIDYTGIDSNKPPQVSMQTNKISGPLPLTINFSSEGTIDLDGDALTYAWDFQSDGTVDSNLENPSFTYTVRGSFTAKLSVTDSKGATVSRSVVVYPGNTAATIDFNFPPDGGMFSWEDNVNFDFDVTDAEDGSTTNNSISCSNVDFVPAFGHLTHSHDGLTMHQCSGTMLLDPTSHDAQGQDNIYYVFKASYTDEDGLTVFDQITIYPKIMEAEFYSEQNNTKLVDNTDVLGGGVYSVRALLHNSYLKLSNRNLQNIDSVSYRVSTTGGGTIEVRADSLTGPVLSTVATPVTGSADRWTNVTARITNPGGKHDLYFIFKNPGAINFLDLNYITFKGNGVSTDVTPPEVYEVKVISPFEISVKYNEAVQKNSAQNISNYSINNGIKISSIRLENDQKTVRITTSPLTVGLANQLSISNIRNLANIPISGSIVKSFTMDAALARINVGGPLVDINGVHWLASKFNAGGTVGSKPGLAINNTTDDVLYQTELNGNFTMNIPVPRQGNYDVKLHFAEIVYKNAGQRVFNINIENGQYSLVNYDIFSKVGYAAALIESFQNVHVEDGYLNITFTGIVNKAQVSAIEVLYGQSSTFQPSITILNPGQNLSLSQPFKVTFKAENWWIANGSSHIKKYVDNVLVGNVYNTEPITFNNLTPGAHKIKLALANADNSITEFIDEVDVNVVSSSACIDNPFPLVWEEYIIGPDVPYRSPHIFASDINRDGYKDIVTGAWWYQNPRSPKGVWTRNVIGAPLNNMFLVYDIDRDGDLDILGTTGAYLGSQLAWAQNDGQGNFTIHSNIPETAGFPPGSSNNNTFLAGAAVGNFNGVANIQIALVWNGSETTKAPVKMLTVPANPVSTTWLVEDIAPNAVGEAIHPVDIDKDGDLDLSQAKNWLRNNGNGTWTTFNTGISLPTYYEHHLISDLDRDGSLDGVLTQIGENQEIVSFKVAADPTKLWTKSTLGTDVDSGLSLDLADLDFDGDLDVITAEWKVEKRLIAFENDLCNTGTWIRHTLHPGGTSAPDHHNGAQTADLDNDGDLDIISIGWDKRTPRIYINNSSTLSGNQPPTVAIPLVDQPGSVGVPFNYIFPDNAFVDPDGDILTYTATLTSGANLPTWLSFNAVTRTFKGTPPAGSVNAIVRVTANDQKGGKVFDEFAIGFTNLPPVVANQIPDQTAPGGQPLTFVFAANTFSDPNGDALTYTASLSNGSALPAWLSFTSGTRTFTGTPTLANAGTYDIRVTANDGQSTVSDVFLYTITDPTVNAPPVVSNPLPDFNAGAGLPFTFTFPANTFSDPNGDALTYSALLSSGSALPGWLHFDNATRTFSGTPGTNNVGTIQIELFASDSSETVSLLFNIVVDAGGSIRLNSGGSTLNAYGTTFNADDYFTTSGVYTNNKIADIAGTTYDELYKTERNKPFSYVVSLPPGTYTVKLHFAEIYFGATGGGSGGIGSRVFNVTAEGVTMLSNFDIFAEVGAMRALIKQFDVSVTDGKLNLTFVKVVQNPKVSAVEIIAKTLISNSPPIVVNPIPDQSATVGTPFTFTFAANTYSDTDNDALTYSASLGDDSALPAWLGFNPATRTFSGTPPTSGPLTVKVTASDGKGGSVSDSFQLNVNENNPGIVATRINAGGSQLTISNGDVFSADKLFASGSVYTNNNISDIIGTNDDALYKSERYKMTAYNIPVPSGIYNLRLHFAEIYFGATGGGPGASGKRVFNVLCEGATILNNFDIYAEVGAMRALIKDFQVTVTDGTLNLSFVKVVDNAKISAIEVIPVNAGARLAGEYMNVDYGEQQSLENELTELTVYPNPFARSTTIEYRPTKTRAVSLDVYTPDGKYVQALHSGTVEAGKVYEFTFDASELPSGFYYTRLISEGRTAVIKLSLTRGD